MKKILYLVMFIFMISSVLGEVNWIVPDNAVTNQEFEIIIDADRRGGGFEIDIPSSCQATRNVNYVTNGVYKDILDIDPVSSYFKCSSSSVFTGSYAQGIGEGVQDFPQEQVIVGSGDDSSDDSTDDTSDDNSDDSSDDTSGDSDIIGSLDDFLPNIVDDPTNNVLIWAGIVFGGLFLVLNLRR